MDALGTPLRRGIAAGVLLLLVAVAGATATSGFGIATADDAIRTGRPVPASQVQTVTTAALACPVLTPARLAGQLMAASAFNPDARSERGGAGIAGLTQAEWKDWKPSGTARRTDPAANIIALAHYMCDLSGQVRQAGVAGDRWRLALAAYHSGVAAVRSAGGIPNRAERYVGGVAGYAAWYARQPEFARSSPTPSPAPVGGAEPSTGTPAVPVPADYLPAIMAAGKTCPAVPPALIAAHLMAASAFNPNLLGSNGSQGIAQFNPVVWARYAPDATITSPWDPHQAIAALGVVMCQLLEEVGRVGRGDPYQQALAAFQLGPDAVQRAGGVPDVPALRTLITLVQTYAAGYGRDPRLGGTPPAGSGRGDSSRSPAAPGGHAAPGGPNPGGAPTGGGIAPPPRTPAGPPPVPPKAPTPPANSQPQPVGSAGPIIGYGSGRCIDVTDGAYESNPQLQIWTCNGGPNQRWTFYSDGTVRAFGRCMSVAGGSTANGAKILLSACSGSSAQRFDLNQAHDLVNVRADKCVDAVDLQNGNGTRLQLWDCGGTSNQKWHR